MAVLKIAVGFLTLAASVLVVGYGFWYLVVACGAIAITALAYLLGDAIVGVVRGK